MLKRKEELEEKQAGQISSQKTTQKTTQKIIEAIKTNSRITRKELSVIIGITEDGIKFNLNALKQADVLKRIGPDKGGYWETK